jgi:hypothetical protein
MNAMNDLRKDQAVQRAQMRRRELEKELQEIDTFLALYQRFAGDVVQADPETDISADRLDRPDIQQNSAIVTPSVTSSLSTPEVQSAQERPQSAGRRPIGMSQEEFNSFIREILLEAGRPLDQPAILDRVHAKGRHVGGKDELSNTKTKLWRAKDVITKIPGAGFWPADVPCPAVNYTPQATG